MPQTLEFVNDCSNHWDVKIYWMELFNIIEEEEYLEHSYSKPTVT